MPARAAWKLLSLTPVPKGRRQEGHGKTRPTTGKLGVPAYPERAPGVRVEARLPESLRDGCQVNLTEKVLLLLQKVERLIPPPLALDHLSSH